MEEYFVTIEYHGVIEETVTADNVEDAMSQAEDIAMMETPMGADDYTISVDQY